MLHNRLIAPRTALGALGLRAALLAACLGGLSSTASAQRAAEEKSPQREEVAAPEEGASTAPLDLNRASEEELQALPGIGPAKARAIVALRERLGGFRHVRQLLRVKGIGRATYRRIQPLVTVGPRSSERRRR